MSGGSSPTPFTDEQVKFITDSLEAGKSYNWICGNLHIGVTRLGRWVLDNRPDLMRGPGMQVKKVSVPDQSQSPSQEEMLRSEISELRKVANKQRKEDVQFERLMAEVENTIRPAPQIYHPPKVSEQPHEKDHVQALLLSDLHCGEVVVAEAVNGLNEFTFDVLKRRIASLQKSLISFQRARKYPIRELHLWLLGDNLSGNIHDELAQTNEFPVVEQCWRVGVLLAQFIEALVEHYPKIVVTGVAGNHPRTQKPHASKQVFDNFDWLAYMHIETYLKNYKSVSCSFPKTGFEVVECAGLNILLWHGDGVRSSMPGVPWGGVMRRWNELRKQYSGQGIHLDGVAVGHYHQANVVMGQIFMNGSLIGLNEFGLKNFGSGEKPTQLLLTFHGEKRRLTDVSYITPV